MEFQIVNINADVGEGFGNEALLMPYLSSCNIACGGHAGNFESMLKVVKLAKTHDVKIGAHPSFPDKENFGRKVLEISSTDLFLSLKDQIKSLIKVLNNENCLLQHIKLHGALYNLAAIDERIAKVVIDVVKSIDLTKKLYVPYKSVIADIAIKNNIEIVYEAFADRNYNSDLTLVSREHKNAVIKDEKLVFNHVYRMVLHQKVKTIQNIEVEIKADTFCLHGDNPKAIHLIKKLSKELNHHGYKMK